MGDHVNDEQSVDYNYFDFDFDVNNDFYNNPALL